MERERNHEYREEETFEDAHILTLTSAEQFDAGVVPPVNFNEEDYRLCYEQMYSLIEELVDSMPLHLKWSDKERLLAFASYLKNHPPVVPYATKPHEAVLDKQLRAQLAGNFPSNNVSGLVFDKIFPDPKKTFIFEGQQTALALANAAGKRVVSCSDSHRSTGAMFYAMSENGFFTDGHETALLSFDHHPDFGPGRAPPGQLKESLDFKKEDIMMSLLVYKYIGSVGVVGVNDYFKKTGASQDDTVSVFFGSELYRDGKPSTEQFEQKMRRLFLSWKQKGIKQIYTSVDLDGLRLDTMGYTGVDYSLERMVQMFVIHSLQLGFDKTIRNIRSKDAELVEIANLILDFLDSAGYDILHGYQGVPAAWINKAMHIAGEFDLEIGITHPQTGQKVVGDVTELHPADKKDRTSRIAVAILKSLLHNGL